MLLLPDRDIDQEHSQQTPNKNSACFPQANEIFDSTAAIARTLLTLLRLLSFQKALTEL